MTPFVALLAALLGDPLTLDPTRVHTFVIGEPQVPRRASRLLLPDAPTIRWRVRVASGIVHPPAALADGSLLVAHAQPTVAKYDAAGRLLWTARLGATSAAASPIMLGDGTSVTFTEGGDAVRLSERGKLLSTSKLPLGSIERPVLGAGSDGNLLIADGRRLVSIDGAGEIAHVTQLEQDIAALLGPPGRPLAIGVSGAVSEIARDGTLRKRWDLGGKIGAAARVDANRLWAVVDRAKLVELDLVRGTVTVRFSDPNVTLGSDLAVNAAGEARLLAGTDLLLAFKSDGSERFRAQLPPSFALTSAGAGDFTLDRAGTVLLVHGGSDAISVLADGSVVRIEGTACGDPLRPTALEGQGVVLACRSGVLVRLGQRR